MARWTIASNAPFSTGNAFSDILTGRLNDYGDATKNVLRNEAYHVTEFYAQDSYKVKPRLTMEFGLRVSHLGNWYDREGIGMAVFDQSQYNPNAAVGDRSGLTWTAIDSSVPLSGAKSSYLFYAPRVGVRMGHSGHGPDSAPGRIRCLQLPR